MLKVLLILIYCSALLLSPDITTITSAQGDVAGINIIAALPNPSGVDSEGEWLALVTDSTGEVHLGDYEIRINTNGWQKLPEKTFVLSAGEVFYLGRDPLIFSSDHPEAQVEKLPIGLTNSPSLIEIRRVASDSSTKFDYQASGDDEVTLIACGETKTLTNIDYWRSDITSCSKPAPTEITDTVMEGEKAEQDVSLATATTTTKNKLASQEYFNNPSRSYVEMDTKIKHLQTGGPKSLPTLSSFVIDLRVIAQIACSSVALTILWSVLQPYALKQLDQIRQLSLRQKIRQLFPF